VRLSSFTVNKPAYSLQQLSNRVKHNLKTLEKQFPELKEEYRKLDEELASLGVNPDETYFYIQGHHIMNGVTMRIMQPVCRHLRSKREEEIERYAYHRQQYNNELASYRHSQCDVATMLSKNTDYKSATPYKRLKADIDRLLLSIERGV
jgi:chaperonin cofactor prefoldin